jgi:hypothetical protein
MKVAAGEEFAAATTCTGEVRVAFGAGVQMVTEGCVGFSVQGGDCANAIAPGSNIAKAAKEKSFLQIAEEDKNGATRFILGP